MRNESYASPFSYLTVPPLNPILGPEVALSEDTPFERSGTPPSQAAFLFLPPLVFGLRPVAGKARSLR